MAGQPQEDYTVVPIALVDATKGKHSCEVCALARMEGGERAGAYNCLLPARSKVHQSYIFSGQLSFKALEDSWNTLVAAWPIIWARIRKDEDSPSGLSYHIPTQARLEQIRLEAHKSKDPKRRPFFCLDKGSEPFSAYFSAFRDDDHKEDTIFTTLAPSSDDFNNVAKANSPTTFSEYLEAEFPLITIQVTRFADATIITRSNSHVYGDGFTMATVLNAWQDILNGKGAPAPLQDIGYDPFAQFGPAPKPLIPWKAEKQASPSPPPGWYILSWRQKLDLVGRFLYDLYYARPESEMQQKYIFVPAREITRLQAQAKEDLEGKATQSESSKNVRIGKSDVLYAWLMKHSHATLPESCISTSLSIINLKGRPPSGVTLPRHNFFCSALPVPLDSLRVGELLSMPLGELALHIRKSHQKYLDPEVQRSSIRFHLQHVLWKEPSGEVPFFCPPHHRWSGLSDLRALRYFQLDFGGALPSNDSIPEGHQSRSARLVAQNVNMSCGMSKRDRWICLGDSEEGAWFTGYLSKKQWEDTRGFGKYEQRGAVT